MTKRPRFGGFCECGEHAWALVGKFFVTFVSPEDAPLIQEKIWTQMGRVDRPYALRKQTSPTKQFFSLHRAVTGATEGMIVDHIDGHGLNNRRHNLRFCTHAENIRNQRRRVARTLPKGVKRRGNRFVANISPNGKTISLGSFLTEIEAAEAYDAAAVEHFGEFARTNEALGIIPASEALDVTTTDIPEKVEA